MKFATCRDVEIFATGTFRGKTYTPRDLDKMAENFKRLGPKGAKLLSPSLAVGHSEEQLFVDRDDMPAIGWVDDVKVKHFTDSTGKPAAKLYANFVDIVEPIARLINSRAFKKCSSEVYDDFVDDANRSYGKALRRVALLGSELPQIKSLADVPLAMFSERRFVFVVTPPKRRNVYYQFHGPNTGPILERNAPMLRRFADPVMDPAADPTAAPAMDARAELESQFMAVVPDIAPEVLSTFTDEQLQALITALGGAAPEPMPVPEEVMAASERRKMQRYAEKLKLDPKQRERVVQTFSERRKRHPSVTAQQHAKEIGIPGV